MSEVTHNHDRDGGEHDHPHHPEHHQPSTYHQKLTAAVLELLVERNVVSADDVTREIAMMEARTPAQGARVVARAWADTAFKERLLADGSAAVRELGIEPGALQLLVVENTDDVHNVVVCTLCSCYPRMLLGVPPAWYKSRPYRARVVREPRAVLAEFGTVIPEGVAIRVHDSTADMRYLVLPRRPANTEGWSEERLATLVTRDGMIGVSAL